MWVLGFCGAGEEGVCKGRRQGWARKGLVEQQRVEDSCEGHPVNASAFGGTLG
jgi:hypothetical protein